jgi:hypothetical protein
MIHSELKKHIKRAIDMLYARDSDLFSQNASEWSIAHRLAVYVECELPEWNVDCEYNRQGQNEAPKPGHKEGNIRPDIIIHHRHFTELDHNLISIELKKVESDHDLERVCEYTKKPVGKREYQYQFALALTVASVPKMRWFKAGKEMTT